MRPVQGWARPLPAVDADQVAQLVSEPLEVGALGAAGARPAGDELIDPVLVRRLARAHAAAAVPLPFPGGDTCRRGISQPRIAPE